MGMGNSFSRNFRKMNNSLKDRLIRHMEDGHYEPQSKSELARALNVDSRQKLDFRALVDQMEEEGKLVRLQKGRYALKRERRNLVHGMIRILRSGKILFLPRKGDPAAAVLGWDTEAVPELELKPNHLGTALDGDRVAVRVERKAARGRRNIRRNRFSSPDADMKARVEEVTERARSRWLGVFCTGKNKPGRVLGDGVSSPSSIELAEKPAMEVLPGQLVSVEPVTCGEEKKARAGKSWRCSLSGRAPRGHGSCYQKIWPFRGIPRLRAPGAGNAASNPFPRGTRPPGRLDGPYRHHH